MIVVVLFTIFFIIYSARISVIKNLAKEQLSLYQIKINCLDISLASNMAIMVDKLCLQSAKADIEIVDMAVQWQYFPQFKITSVDVKLAKVKGTEHLFSNTSHNAEENKQSNWFGNEHGNISHLLSVTLQPHLNEIEEFQLPFDINIANISYLPFTVTNKSKTAQQSQQKSPYVVSVSAVNNSFNFSLQNPNETEFMRAKLTKAKFSKNKGIKGFSIELSSELNLLKNFANEHQLPITVELQNTLNASEISGRIKTIIEYQSDSLSMQSKITDLIMVSDNGIGKDVAFKLMADLDFETQLPLTADQEMQLTFLGQNAMSIAYSQPNFTTMVEKSQMSPDIISLITGNPLAKINLNPKDNATMTLNKKQLNLSGIDISASGDKRMHRMQLDNISLDFSSDNLALNGPDDSENTATQPVNALTIDSFIIDSQLKLSTMAKFTTVPLDLHLEGSLQKNNKQTELTLNDKSSITAKNIVLTQQQGSSAAVTTTTKNKILLKLQTFTTKLEGYIQLMADNALSVNVKALSQASQVSIPKTLQINSFDLISEIKGNFDDIHINATASADEVNLGSITIFGPPLSPKVKLTANKLQLTDLLSLNIQLPTKIELIDGLLGYSVSGQLADWNHIEKSPFSISVALTSVSGEVDGIWIQELNWQQSFTLFAGKIATLPNATENLTVGLIETPTPISKLSINTSWTFNKSFKFSAKKLKADVLGGSFSIPKVVWPFEHGHSVNVQLNSIDLEQVLALDKKQGIVVTGDISGELPITFDGEKYIIENGELYNISNGLIQVMDNPTVAELKENNTQLQLAFEALQNLHYHQLSSAVSMADDGYMLLETVIKGRNPDINNDVNLNLNLSYDLLGLLESMSITQRFEESIIKGLQKNKE
jgi:hypothetical protein